MTSRLAERLGAQLPRIECRPQAVPGSWGAEVADLAAASGVELDPWQRHVLDVGLAEGPDGLFAALEVALLVPRQNGKSVILAALALAAPFVFDAELVLFSAHEFKTTLEIYELVTRMVADGPLAKLHKQNRRSGAETGVEFRNGARIRFVARSRGSGRGFSADLVILDEAFKLDPRQLGALLPTLSARPNPQVWLASSAPMSDSEVLHRVRARALSSTPGRLAFMEWSVPPGTTADDRAGWAVANPALGQRLKERVIEMELDAMLAAEFERERLGIGDAPAGEDVPSPIDPDAWGRQQDRGATMTGRLCLGLAVAPDLSRSTIAVAGPRAGGGWLIEVIETRAGTTWVPGQLVELRKRNPDLVAVALDPGSPAGTLLADIEAVGVPVVKLGPRDSAQGTGSLIAHVVGTEDQAPDVWHLGQPDLDDAVAGARTKQLGDLKVWDRRASTTYVGPLEAGTLAFAGLHHLPDEPEDDTSVYAERGFVEW